MLKIKNFEDLSLFVSILALTVASTHSQNLQQSLFTIFDYNSSIGLNSSSLIARFSCDKSKCILECNLNSSCGFVILDSFGMCSICMTNGLTQLKPLANGYSSVFQKLTPSTTTVLNTIGLINYWPINNDLKDYIGHSDLSPGSNLASGEVVGFGADRFNNSNSSIYMNSGYYSMPPGVYFNSTWSFITWMNPISTSYSRVIDCGNGQGGDNVIVVIANGNSQEPGTQLFRGSTSSSFLQSSITVSTNNWYHLAVTLDATATLIVYLNGQNVAQLNNSLVTNGVLRNNCYFGRSNWYSNDADARVYLDEIKIYSRALSASEILNDMNSL